MTLFNYTKPAMIVADRGKKIRDKNDVYTEAYIDEDENRVEEHFPYYATTIFVPDDFTEEMMNDLYIEEIINE